MPIVQLTDEAQLDKPSKITSLGSDIVLDEPKSELGKGAFYGIAHLLPESVQKHLPSFMTGPSAMEQITSEPQRIAAEEQRLGRPLSRSEKLTFGALSSPVAMGFAANRLGGDVPIPKIGTAGRAEFSRSVKPSVGSVKAAGGREPYYAKAESGIQSIVENQPNLHFVDADGNVVEGKLPRSLEQFDDAISQTKQRIFQKYNAMAQKAGQFGPPVDLRPVVTELNKIATDPVEKMLRPEVADYAAKRAMAFLSQGTLWADQAQSAVQNLNSTLKALYSSGKPPDFDLVARANIDALIANKLRAGLDDVVEKGSGPGYQDLKNEYGALKAIENDVKRRSTVVARQESGGGILGRIADVASAEEVLRGLATFSPERVVTGGFLKAWQQFVRHRRDPNRAVANLFKRASTPVVPPRPVSPFAAVSSNSSVDNEMMRQATAPLPPAP